MNDNYSIDFTKYGLKITANYDEDLSDDLYEQQFFISLDQDMFLWELMIQKFPNIEEEHKIVTIDDIDSSMPEEIQEYAEEIIEKHLGEEISKWADKEIKRNAESSADAERLRNNPYAYYGVSEKD